MRTTVAETPSTVLPPEDLAEMLDVSHFLEQAEGPAVLVGPDGQHVNLPVEAHEVLAAVAHAMALGKGITIALVDQVLTTQEAADFLGISRPTLVKLLVSGQIPFEQPAAGRHRRLRLQDVVDYQQSSAKRRAAVLDEMTAEAVDAGLYGAPVDYSAALKRARAVTGKNAS